MTTHIHSFVLRDNLKSKALIYDYYYNRHYLTTLSFFILHDEYLKPCLVIEEENDKGKNRWIVDLDIELKYNKHDHLTSVQLKCGHIRTTFHNKGLIENIKDVQFTDEEMFTLINYAYIHLNNRNKELTVEFGVFMKLIKTLDILNRPYPNHADYKGDTFKSLNMFVRQHKDSVEQYFVLNSEFNNVSGRLVQKIVFVNKKDNIKENVDEIRITFDEETFVLNNFYFSEDLSSNNKLKKTIPVIRKIILEHI